MKFSLNNKYLNTFSYVNNTLNSTTFLVGGFIRDSLLNKESNDLDFSTSVLPDEIYKLFPNSLYFKKYGTISFKYEDINITIATFRKEENYSDYRHPDKVSFISDYKIDALRRDFTINSLYVDKDMEILDPTSLGLNDIQNKIIRTIGIDDIRLKEDPLRILRAYRFKYELSFDFSSELQESIIRNSNLLLKLNKSKIEEEINKCPQEYRKNIISELNLEKIIGNLS